MSQRLGRHKKKLGMNALSAAFSYYLAAGRRVEEMEEDGLIERKQYREMPVRVEYSLTEKAHSMIPILLELKHWGEKHL